MAITQQNTMKIHNVSQRTPEWLELRKSVLITASEMGPWLVKTDATSAKAKLTHIVKKLAAPIYEDESLFGHEFLAEIRAKEDRSFDFNIPVQRGNALEAEARLEYERLTGQKVTEIGFITDNSGRFGCSPDGVILGKLLVNEEWIDDDPIHGLEIKCPIPETHLKWLFAGGLPDEHKFQVHGSMAVSSLTRWDFLSFCPGLPPLLVTVERDTTTDALAAGLDSLHAEYVRCGMTMKRLYESTFEGREG